MAIIQKSNMVLEADVDGTKEYYRTRTPLAGVIMENFAFQAREAAPLLVEFFDEFGVDITKPDELCWCWKDENRRLHYNVAYTICGKIIKSGQRNNGKKMKEVDQEIILRDKSEIHVVLESTYIPNEQKQSYFGFTVYNIEMDWMMEEEFPEMQPAEDNDISMPAVLEKILRKIKKCWTK